MILALCGDWTAKSAPLRSCCKNKTKQKNVSLGFTLCNQAERKVPEEGKEERGWRVHRPDLGNAPVSGFRV